MAGKFKTCLTMHVQIMHLPVPNFFQGFWHFCGNILNTLGEKNEKSALYLRRDRNFTWSSEPREGLAICRTKAVPSFLSHF